MNKQEFIEQVADQLELQEGKEQETIKEFIEILPKLYPNWYPINFKDWPVDSWGKGVVDREEFKTIESNLFIYKKQLAEKEQENIKKEFIKSLNELYPDSYSTDPTKWFNKDGKAHPMKVHYDNNNFYVMEYNTKIYKKEIEKIKAKKLEEAKKLKEENLEKEQLLSQKDQLLNNKDNLLIDKDKKIDKLKELLLIKEIEKEELLVQISLIEVDWHTININTATCQVAETNLVGDYNIESKNEFFDFELI